MIIKNASVLCDDFVFRNMDVEINDCKIARIDACINGDDEYDASGKMLIPGLVDIHSHGCVGFDTCDRKLDGYEKMTQFYASQGVTSFLFTTMTFSEDILTDVLQKVCSFIDSGRGASYAHGIYMEGPFINPIKKGAQNGQYIIGPDYEMFNRLQNIAGGRIKVVAVAPEIEGSMDYISKVSGHCAVTLAHTDADYDTASKAFKAGAKSLTHTFNAMPGIQHRVPGPIPAAVDNDGYTELICDGIHLHPAIIRMMFKLGQPDRTILVSDSMQAAGMPDGIYELGGQAVYLKNKKATLKDGTIAGSAVSLMDCVRNCVEFGIKPEYAVKAATANPAELVGISDVVGSITAGKSADLVLVEKDFSVSEVWIRGERQ